MMKLYKNFRLTSGPNKCNLPGGMYGAPGRFLDNGLQSATHNRCNPNGQKN